MATLGSVLKLSSRLVSSQAMSKLVLYTAEASPPSSAVRFMAHKLRLQMKHEEPKLLQLEHKTAEFKKINPMGMIPVLKDGDFTISESQAIILYLVEKYGADQRSQLYPGDLETRTFINQCLFFNAGYFFIRLKNVALPTLMGGLKCVSDQHRVEIDEAYSVVEAYLATRKYIAADYLTVADICCGSTASALQGIHALDAERFPKTKKWMDCLEEEDGYKEIVSGGGQKLGKILQIFWSKNA